MSIFTITPGFLENIGDGESSYLADILFVFSNKNNSFKVSKDKNGSILDIYRSIENNSHIIKTWLDLMANTPSPFEKVDVNIEDILCMETKFIKICKETKGFNNLIVYSFQNIQEFKCNNKYINYEGINIKVYDRDDANSELNKSYSTTNNYINSQVATDNSQITDSNNN